MEYKLLNELQFKKMEQISNNDFKMEWEDPNFMDILMGNLPTVHRYQNDSDISSEISSLEKTLSSYDSFLSDKDQFLKKIKAKVEIIQSKKSNWYGLSLYEVEKCVLQHKFCLISGEGGIGKSYFIKCLEEKLRSRKIPHLCIYGKFEKDTHNIDVEEIIRVGATGIVFIVDAVNEMSEAGQNEFLQLLAKLKEYRGIRIVVTYRTNAMDIDLLNRYKKISCAEYRFPGVSFEAALGTLLKLPVPDVYKYEDILYSNNALLLSMLCSVLSNIKIADETENSIASVTFILEQYIKKSIGKTFKGRISSQGVDIWEDTKRVAKWLYEHEEKKIDKKSLLSIIKTGSDFLPVMIQSGFMSDYERGSERYLYFTIDSLTDFLVARSLFDDIRGKTFKEQVNVIKRKIGKLYNMEEAVIIAIFDNLAPEYDYISKLLSETSLMEDLQYETLVKINFVQNEIKKFLEVFSPSKPRELLGTMGGYTDKPFNCTNYLNDHYKKSNNQQKELSEILSGDYLLGHVKGRLKNILYFIALDDRDNRRVDEAYSFALWCCAAPNKDVRCLAMKLLYETIIKEPAYKDKLIEEYECLTDDYIKEAVIYVLATFSQNDIDIINFFKGLIVEETYLTAKSVKRIAKYLNEPYGYINWERKNLYTYQQDAVISDFMNRTFLKVDLMNKGFLPFRYLGKNHINMHIKFLKNDKKEINNINKLLEQKYACVKDGNCNGNPGFEGRVMFEITGKNSIDTLDLNSFFCSYEEVLKNTLATYYTEMDEKNQHVREENFDNSVYMKCVDIATGMYYGSLMCNYYTAEFATYNNCQDSIGYEVYDPIEYGEEVIITSPIPTYQDFVERLGDFITNRIEIPIEKNVNWVKDVSLTRKNLLSLLKTVEIKNVEWVMLAGRVSLHEKEKYDIKWEDTYDIWCCTSENETIIDDGNARYLTIEIGRLFW